MSKLNNQEYKQEKQWIIWLKKAMAVWLSEKKRSNKINMHTNNHKELEVMKTFAEPFVYSTLWLWTWTSGRKENILLDVVEMDKDDKVNSDTKKIYFEVLKEVNKKQN